MLGMPQTLACVLPLTARAWTNDSSTAYENARLLALERQLAALGGELEQLVLIGVHAVAVYVADLARGRQRQHRLHDGVAADERRELGVDDLHLRQV